MKKLIYLSGILVLLLSSCSEEEISTYKNNVAGAYFQTISSTWSDGSEVYTDSLSFSFASLDASRTSASQAATVRIMGKVTNYDRKVSVIINPEGTTAKQGVNFDARLDSIYIPAGKSSVYVPVTFYRTEDLLKNTYRVQLELVANDEFKLVPDSFQNSSVWNSSSNVKLPGNKFTFIFSEKYKRPNYWEWYCEDEFFGTWTATKYLFVNSVMGWTVADWQIAGSTGAKVAYGRLGYAAGKVRDALQALADAGTPKLDENGKYMQLINPYQVDYSAYNK